MARRGRRGDREHSVVTAGASTAARAPEIEPQRHRGHERNASRAAARPRALRRKCGCTHGRACSRERTTKGTEATKDASRTARRSRSPRPRARLDVTYVAGLGVTHVAGLGVTHVAGLFGGTRGLDLWSRCLCGSSLEHALVAATRSCERMRLGRRQRSRTNDVAHERTLRAGCRRASIVVAGIEPDVSDIGRLVVAKRRRVRSRASPTARARAGSRRRARRSRAAPSSSRASCGRGGRRRGRRSG